MLLAARFTIIAALLALAGCASTAGSVAPVRGPGPRTEPMSADQMAQTDFNRAMTVAMRDNLSSMDVLAAKLYRRNPREWRRTGQASHDAAVAALQRAIETQTPPAGLNGLRDIQILAVSLDPAYQGDRVAAFIYGMADTIIAAHDGKTRFYVASNLDAQRLYNAARNIETAAWLLASRRDINGLPLLYANEMSAEHTNLSFEREFGALIGRLDLVANLVGENVRRVGINYAQGLLFFNFLPVR